MAHVCPPWIARLMLNPLRKFRDNPDKMFGPFVRPGMTVLEPGCGMGFFTLPLARMVGEGGRVVVVEVQREMLEGLEKRARRAGLWERLDCRLVESGLGVGDLVGRVDFAAAVNMVHETPDQAAFFREAAAALKPGAALLVEEPKFHVSAQEFEAMVETAVGAGLRARERSGYRVVFEK